MIKPSKLFSTKDLAKWTPFYSKNGERVIDALDNNGINYNEIYLFFQKHGDTLLQFVEKMTIDEMKGNAYKEMSDVQKAFIGHTELFNLMKELSTEVYAVEQDKKK